MVMTMSLNMLQAIIVTNGKGWNRFFLKNPFVIKQREEWRKYTFLEILLNS